MLVKGFYLDVLAVYVFGLYISHNSKSKQIETRRFYLNKMDLVLDTFTYLAQIIPG